MLKRIILSSAILWIALSVRSQVAMGEWRMHFAYNQVERLAQSENKLFAVSEGKLFSIDKRDNSIDTYSKLTGLTSNNISNIAYDESSSTLLITYANGHIDFLSSNGIFNLPDFFSKQMSADKAVNDILFHKRNAYLATDFGILVLDLDKKQIKDTYYIGPNASEVKVLTLAEQNGLLYALTAFGVFTADLNDPLLISYERWNLMPGLPGNGELQALYTYGDELILFRNHFLYRRGSDNNWSAIDFPYHLTHIQVSDKYLITHTPDQSFYWDESFSPTEFQGMTGLITGLYDKKNKEFWLGGNDEGVTLFNSQNREVSSFKPNGPATNSSYKLKFGEERLFMLQGGRWADRYFLPGIVTYLDEGIWHEIKNEEVTQNTLHMAADFMNIAVDPEDKNHFHIPSYGNGVFEFKNNQFYFWHNMNNSTLESVLPGSNSRLNYMRNDAGVYDKDGNIWFSSSGTPSLFQIRKKDGSWMKLGSTKVNNLPTVSEILISGKKPQQKWLLSARHNPGLVVLDDNGTLETTGDDKYVFHTSFNYFANNDLLRITPNYFYSIAQDKNGSIWIGTDMGPLVINNPDKVFDSDFQINRVIIPRHDGTGLGDYLLKDEHIKAIAVDGANRKWLGTQGSGIYLVSENGLETLRHFTTDNSPLISNEILSIAIHPISGEVFIGTDKGLISYQSDAALGHSVFTNVHAYPNPVRENFEGVITIAGLVDKTQVKIVDTAGNLVFETQSNGSIATWNARNKHNQKVSTGVYIALCISPDGEESAHAKILIIN